ncbi:MAG: hypothetical protein B6244_12415 [Candidatus Cloacimonetes bacterium 4572_55]|nr:MAG: hypothetical protein B6244_12415 [Candidatus Cloacimonetes bacterium 4572_55]
MRLSKLILIFTAFMFLITIVQADAGGMSRKTETKLDFKGALGAIMKMGGAEKPIIQAETVVGNKRRIDTLDKKGEKAQSSDIIDLDNELLITLDHKKKKYTQMTFAEWREMLETGFGELGAPVDEGEEPPDDEPETEVEFKADLSVEATGEKKDFNSHSAEKMIMTIKMEAEAEQQTETGTETGKGGVNVISTMWVSEKVEGIDVFDDFNLLLVEKLGMTPTITSVKGVMDNLMANNSELADAMGKAEEELEKLDGTTWVNETRYESWGEKKEQVDDSGSSTQPFGGIAKGLFGKKKDKDDDKPSVLLESQFKIIKIEPASAKDDFFQAPENYKLEKTAYQKIQE